MDSAGEFGRRARIHPAGPGSNARAARPPPGCRPCVIPAQGVVGAKGFRDGYEQVDAGTIELVEARRAQLEGAPQRACPDLRALAV